MKSPQVECCSYILDKDRYSDLQVLQSGAGYYIGTTYSNKKGFTEPGTRDSEEYFRTHELAQAAFESNKWTQRYHP